MVTSAYRQWELNFGKNPIVLTGGIAANMPGAALPIINILSPGLFPDGPTSSPPNQATLDQSFATFTMIPGGTVIDNQWAKFPLANQAVASNSIITEPLAVSLMMIVPATMPTTWSRKLSIITSLRQQLSQHINMGGVFTVVTPSYFYTNCLLLTLTDVSSEQESKQPQLRWRWDFVQPLLTLADAQAAQSSFLNKVSGGQQFSGQPAWTGAQANTGSSSGIAAPNQVPGASSSAGGGLQSGTGGP